MSQFDISLELKGLDLCDARLNERCIKLLKSLEKHPKESIPTACQTHAEIKAAYRFFKNPKVTPEKLLAPHIQATKERCKAQSVVLYIEDTTEEDFTDNSCMQKLGRLDHENRKGMYCHTGLAITQEGTPLGLLSVQFFDRQEESTWRTKDYIHTSLEEKESFRWVQGIRKASKLAQENTNTQVIYVADRESDTFHCLFEATKEITCCHVILRACKDRNTTSRIVGAEKKYKKLFSTLEAMPVQGEVTFQTQSGYGKKARLITQTIRFGSVEILPKKPQHNGYHPVTIHAVMLKEKNPPAGHKAVDWVLLTTMPVKTTEDALRIIKLYTKRWKIEIFFKILKMYCKIEDLKLVDPSRLKACTSLYMVVAWRLLLLEELGKECPEEACTIAFTETEWKVVYLSILKRKKQSFDQLPKEPPPLKEFIPVLASLGGFMGRKGDGRPGPKTLYHGYVIMRALVEGWELCQSSKTCG